jgi:hypothetical protein
VKDRDACSAEIHRTLCTTTFEMVNTDGGSHTPFPRETEYCGHQEIGYRTCSGIRCEAGVKPDTEANPITICEQHVDNTQLVCGPAPWCVPTLSTALSLPLPLSLHLPPLHTYLYPSMLL